MVMDICHLTISIQTSGHNITDTQAAYPTYNNNKSCIKWLHNMTTKQIRHIKMCKNTVREFMCALSDFLQQQSLIDIHHSRQHDEPTHQKILPLAASLSTSFAKGSYLLALCLSPFSRT
jgi:hypothetical protein